MVDQPSDGDSYRDSMDEREDSFDEHKVRGDPFESDDEQNQDDYNCASMPGDPLDRFEEKTHGDADADLADEDQSDDEIKLKTKKRRSPGNTANKIGYRGHQKASRDA